MESNFFTLGGFGQFVWPAFIFTFTSCLILYLKTKKELQKQEKMLFSENKELEAEKIIIFEEKENTQEAFSTN
ncbi:hypothetical protein N8084_01970 [Pelagibacteraceae bacterium]|jgi:heme exporter protein D|nr:hypothetical protein [Pelagibacteraceae bacterium]|tara:strand:+ start:244 stop:462 length:219 start_codon:yes stop_codon:yes gene_type:complete